MKRFAFYFFTFSLCLLTALPLFACSFSGGGNVDSSVNMDAGLVKINSSSEVQMLEDVRGAVVGIAVNLNNGYAIGSGVAVADGGYILTNNHVVDKERGITLFYADKTTGPATVLWKDSALDLAIIKAGRNIPYLPTSPSNNLRVGEDVFAIGTPLTLEFKHTVTKGIISAKGRVLQTGSTKEGATYLQSLVQHDASINPGNSGGPLINLNGQVVGINTLKATEGEGLGFAVPIEVATAIMARVAEDNTYTPPYIGIFGFDADIAAANGQEGLDRGVYVISTSGPSKTAGIKSGDIIKRIGSYTIETMLDLRTAIYHFDIGDLVTVTYERNGSEQTVSFVATKK